MTRPRRLRSGGRPDRRGEDVERAFRDLTARGYTFNEAAPFDIPPGKLVTLNDPDGNLIGFIDNSKGGMPGQAR